jgi:hypothetical protein
MIASPPPPTQKKRLRLTRTCGASWATIDRESRVPGDVHTNPTHENGGGVVNDGHSARLSVLPLEGNESAVQEIFERFLKERGNVPNMFRTVGHLPKHLETMITHFVTVMRQGSVPARLKEMISVRVSWLNGCRY